MLLWRVLFLCLLKNIFYNKLSIFFTQEEVYNIVDFAGKTINIVKSTPGAIQDVTRKTTVSMSLYAVQAVYFKLLDTNYFMSKKYHQLQTNMLT